MSKDKLVRCEVCNKVFNRSDKIINLVANKYVHEKCVKLEPVKYRIYSGERCLDLVDEDDFDTADEFLRVGEYLYDNE